MTAGTAGPCEALTLVIGSESLLVERAIDSIVREAKKQDAATERRDIDGGDVGLIGRVEEATSPTLFGGGAVVVINNVENADEDSVEAIIRCARHASAEISVVAVHAGGVKGKKFGQILGKAAATTIECPEIKKGRGVSDFVSAEIKRHKRSMDQQAQDILIAAVGSDVRALASACAQLANDIESHQIEADDVSRYFGGTVDVTGFQIADEVMNRNGARALRLIRLAEGTDGARLGPATVASLTNSVRQLIAVATAPPGMSDRDLAVHAKVPPWKIRQLNQQLRRWTQRDLAEAILVLGDLDAAMKGGLREGEQLEPAQKGLAIETAVVSLSHR